ncbi:unnamed protein product [Miscanthus lutarioriparius]|uniref:Uncharacterized protein n=1 Tax=Miscanthus lutarioriparius TaxID=422564 RepID=A0A811PHG2_9POAL|nr:unnamed protein product [Miscanthus lutarioriparius]
MNDACEKIKELAEDKWKDMLEQCLALTELPKVMPRTVFDFARTIDNMYKNDHDGFTSSEALKEMIELLFVKPIPNEDCQVVNDIIWSYRLFSGSTGK